MQCVGKILVPRESLRNNNQPSYLGRSGWEQTVTRRDRSQGRSAQRREALRRRIGPSESGTLKPFGGLTTEVLCGMAFGLMRQKRSEAVGGAFELNSLDVEESIAESERYGTSEWESLEKRSKRPNTAHLAKVNCLSDLFPARRPDRAEHVDRGRLSSSLLLSSSSSSSPI